jgi:hypothetical protein
MKRKSVGRLLRDWRDEAGLKLDRAAVYASDAMGVEVSSEKIRRYETGSGPAGGLDPLLLLTLVRLYGHDVADLPDAERARVNRIIGIISGDVEVSTLSEQGGRYSGCITEDEAEPLDRHLVAAGT